MTKNGFFGSGLMYWTLFGGYDFNIVNNEMRLWRTSASTNPAVLFQNQIGQHFTPNSPLRLTFRMGNSSNVTKNVQVSLREANYVQNFQCSHAIPPNTSMTTVIVQGVTKAQ